MDRFATDRKPEASELLAMNKALAQPLNLLNHGDEAIKSALSSLNQYKLPRNGNDRSTVEGAVRWLEEGRQNGFKESTYNIIGVDGLSSLAVSQDGSILAYPYWRQWERSAKSFIEAGFKVAMQGEG